MKKFLSILLAVVLIFSVLTCVGCEADKKRRIQLLIITMNRKYQQSAPLYMIITRNLVIQIIK